MKTTVVETKEDVVSRDDDLEIKHEEFANNQNSETKYTMNKENTITNVVTKFDKYAGTGTAGVKGKMPKLKGASQGSFIQLILDRDEQPW